MLELSEIHSAKILIVDDQPANVQLLDYILGGAGYNCVTSTMDSREVFKLYRQHEYDLIVLDLNMPHRNGFEVIESLKSIERWGYLPVLVVTAEPAHKLKALGVGAKDFISKPFENVEVLTRIYNMLEVRLQHKKLHDYAAVLEARVRARTAELRDSYRETILTMTSAAENRDTDTGLHIQRIGLYCETLAARLGMSGQFRDEIFYASPMHDIGKIAIPDHILLKPGAFTAPEWEIMKTHTTAGAKILGERKSPYLKMGAEIALNHHERWDGGGYPNGLAGEAIPLPARIMYVCDIYDALRCKRPYKPALDHATAIEIITRGDGRTLPEHFDPAILHAFLDAREEFHEIYRASGDSE
jgi:putative two-component system response regulator